MKITTKEILTSEVTTIVDYKFLLQVDQDGELIFTKWYGSALEAVKAYNTFNDHGTAERERTVVLIEPNGTLHSKVLTATRRAVIR